MTRKLSIASVHEHTFLESDLKVDAVVIDCGGFPGISNSLYSIPASQLVELNPSYDYVH